jgi:hypothetical protein
MPPQPGMQKFDHTGAVSEMGAQEQECPGEGNVVFMAFNAQDVADIQTAQARAADCHKLKQFANPGRAKVLYQRVARAFDEML